VLLTAYRTKLLLARTILTPLIICCQEQLCVEEEPRTKAQQEEQEAFLRAIGDEEDIKTLVQGMAKYPSDPAIQEGACGRLGELAIKTWKERKAIANLGGIQALLKAMKEHPSEAKVQERAWDALYILSSNDDTKALIKKEGGEELVRRAISAPNATDYTKKWGQMLLNNLAQC
jgi:hypothetical protein